MAYQPTRTEGQALHMIAIALRPEWATMNPGQKWFEQTNGVFDHAENFEHCIDALISYCKQERNGTKTFKTPSLYTSDGDHWTTTVPANLHKPPRDVCTDHPMDKNNRQTCIGCRSEILAGDRPHHMQGKPLTPETRQPVPSPGIRNQP